MPRLRSFELRPGPPQLANAGRPAGWLLILCVMLCLWEPLGVALAVSAEMSGVTLGHVERAAFLAFRVLVAGVGVAAGIAIWNRQPHALTLAKIALPLSAATVIIRLGWFPGNVPPGLRLPRALLLVGYNAAWYAYVSRLSFK